ncbi:helix-turn-helix domain-containing protein [Saccharopolyspora elongata]|uniref:helix-turn-helix domain-containing protein n=1 Tax=Saccharopolyspora elongata TaxID=2530387 RepID=UPI001A9ED019|nr:helix-turn-helix transcriptional regulator [Saccharopolyspora elongata]
MNDSEALGPHTISPTVGRRWLAQEIKRLREAAGLKQSDVAKRLRCNPAKIAHIESMRNAVSGPDLEVMLPFLGVPPERVDWHLQLADLAKGKGWWDGNRAIPDWFSLYIGLEWGASEIHEWDLGFVPGLLQTRAYTEALINAGSRVSDVQQRQQVEARLQRQGALHRDTDALKLHAIVDESVLHRTMGDDLILRDQIAHLAAMSEHPQVTLQIMPFHAGPHRGHLGSFHWLGFPRADDPGVVYVENQKGGLYLEEPEEITDFRADFDRLAQTALPAEDSRNLLEKLVKGKAQ